jgi:hypothetical protein
VLLSRVCTVSAIDQVHKYIHAYKHRSILCLKVWKRSSTHILCLNDILCLNVMFACMYECVIFFVWMIFTLCLNDFEIDSVLVFLSRICIRDRFIRIYILDRCITYIWTGRMGDTAIIGAGVYASDQAAIACTGTLYVYTWIWIYVYVYVYVQYIVCVLNVTSCVCVRVRMYVLHKNVCVCVFELLCLIW